MLFRRHGINARRMTGGAANGRHVKITAIESLHADGGGRVFDFLKITTDDGLVGWSEYNEAFGGAGRDRRSSSGSRRSLIGKDPRAVEAHVALMQALRRAAAGGVDPAGDRRDRERAARHQGEGARHPGLRAAGRPGARPHPPVLVALRHVPGRPARRDAGLPPLRSLDDIVALGKEVVAQRLHGAEDQRHPVRRRTPRGHVAGLRARRRASRS